ncbi:PSP1 C-terminal conserved region [uncultured Clostridium sp.]|nr:PSP1 C-terminal conserved region [uncultured Clostridium sp.]
MTKIIGVRFRTAGKVYYFDPKNMEIKRGQHVIVETARGTEYGHVVVGTKEVSREEVVQPLKPVIRVATAEDDEHARRNREKEREAMAICHQKIIRHNLDMKLIDAEYTFDNNKILFYFTADGRIDFRELVKDLAVVFKMRIELRQIGVRDETKILGGVGICGRPLCCHTYLSEFAPVSIKMAKEQNLSLNPTKISGVCGRLMCCLKNEEDTYEYLNSRLPDVGETVTLPDGGKGEVHSVNVLRQTVKVLVEVDDGKEMSEYPVAELKFRPRKRKNTKEKPVKEAVKEMAEGEQETGAPKESREPKESKEPKERKGGRGRDGESEPRERKGNREGERESRERRNNRHGSRRDRDGREAREGKGSRESREVKAADTTEKES